MIRSFAICQLVFFLLLATTARSQDLMPPEVISQLGLTQAWVRPVPVPSGAQSIAGMKLFAHQTNLREYVEIVATANKDHAKQRDDAAQGEVTDAEGKAAEAKGKVADAEGEVLVRIPTDRRGMDGQPIGKKEAERLANNQLRRLKRRGIDATLNTRTVPRVHLYTIGTDGTLECRDAETGETVWLSSVGDRRLPYMEIGTDEKFLTIINGGNLIKVEASTGEVMDEVRLSGAPMFGALNAGDFSMVPMIGGGVAGYPLADPTRDPFNEIVAGSTLALPTKAPGSSKIAWGTNRGFVYVMEMEGEPSVLFRLNTDGNVAGRIASASGERFFFGSDSGQAYCLRATRSGIVQWSRPFGEPFYKEPMVVDERVLIRSTYGNLFGLDINTGMMTWDRPLANMGDLISAFGGRVYLTTLSGALAVVEVETGKQIGRFNRVRPGRLLVNTLTDRLYLVSESGEIQCLRPVDSELPTIREQPYVAPADEESEGSEKTNEGAPFDPTGADPFAAGADPFGAGGGGDPFGAGGGADPFGAGGGGDPFGAGGGGDPFGGGEDQPAMDDPFGGNPFDN